MTVWILILFMQRADISSGVAIAHIDFTTREKCMQAGALAMDAGGQQFGYRNVKAICVPK